MVDTNFDYTYRVDTINVEQGTFVVHYVPVNDSLTPVSINAYLIPRLWNEILDANNETIFTSQDEVPFSYHLQNTIDVVKPIAQWQNQILFLNNYDAISSANGSATVDTSSLRSTFE